MDEHIIWAYDKDGDVYDEMFRGNYHDCRTKVKELYRELFKGNLRRKDNGEVYDWLCIEPPTSNGKVYYINPDDYAED